MNSSDSGIDIEDTDKEVSTQTEEVDTKGTVLKADEKVRIHDIEILGVEANDLEILVDAAKAITSLVLEEAIKETRKVKCFQLINNCIYM